jgi:hypothetical protein
MMFFVTLVKCVSTQAGSLSTTEGGAKVGSYAGLSGPTQDSTVVNGQMGQTAALFFFNQKSGLLCGA